MADESLEIVIELGGAEKATADLNKVAEAVDKAGDKANDTETQLSKFDRELERAGRLSQTTANSFNELAQKQMLASQRSIEFTQKLSGAANAAQTLSAQLGASGGAAGLIGALTGAAAQGAQLGAIFGPGGAFVGGVVGAAIPALTALTASANDSGVTIERLVRTVADGTKKFEDFLAAIQTADRAANRTARLGMGLGSSQEQQASIAETQARIDRTEAALRGARTTRQGMIGVEETARQDAFIRGLESQLSASRVMLEERRRMTAQVEREITEDRLAEMDVLNRAQREKDAEEARRRTESAEREAQQSASRAQQMQREREQRLEQLMSTAGGSSQLGDRSIVITDGERRADEAAKAREAAEREAAQAAQQAEREHNELLSQRRELMQGLLTDFDNITRRQQLEKSGIDEVNQAYHEMFANLLQQSADAPEELARDFESALLRMRETHERMTDSITETTRRAAQEQRQAFDDMAKQGMGFASSLGGAFSDAFQQAIAGEADFGKAFEQGIKKQLMNFGTVMVAEGVGALATGIGFTFTNPPAAAGKFAEGGIKIGLGVGLGAAGAAIPSAPATTTPASPTTPKAGGDSGGGNYTTVVNWNQPTVTAGTTNQLGREMARVMRQSSQRFGAGV